MSQPTRAQYFQAVDAVHDIIHALHAPMAELDAGKATPEVRKALRDGLNRVHEVLHAVGGGTRPVECHTADPEVQVVVAEFTAKLAQDLPTCGHALGDLIGGKGSVTKCGACIAARQTKPVEDALKGDEGAAYREFPNEAQVRALQRLGGCWVRQKPASWGSGLTVVTLEYHGNSLVVDDVYGADGPPLTLVKDGVPDGVFDNYKASKWRPLLDGAPLLWSQLDNQDTAPQACTDPTKMNGYCDQQGGTDDPRVDKGDW